MTSTGTQTISQPKNDWSQLSLASKPPGQPYRASWHPRARPVQHSILLQIPTDVLLLVCDHLELPTALSLSLACRDAHALLYHSTRKRLSSLDKRKFLAILEGDPLVPGLYNCFPCGKLHPFKQHWGPHSRLEDAEAPKYHHCGRRDRFCPIGNPYELSFTHAHLVMNRHRYGDAFGLPLKRICVEHTSARDVVAVKCQTDARIIDDELYLHRTYSFAVPRREVPLLRRCTGNKDFRICEHTSFFQNSSVYRQYIPQLMRRPWGGDDEGLVECSRAPGSCGLCLMDFDVTIESASAAAGGPRLMSEDSFNVTIRTFHNVGECRAPDDWKWARFTESCRPHLFFPNRPNRRGSTAIPGMLKKRWVEDAGGDGEVVTRAVENAKLRSKKQAAKLPFELPAFTVGRVNSKDGRGALVVKVEAFGVQ